MPLIQFRLRVLSTVTSLKIRRVLKTCTMVERWLMVGIYIAITWWQSVHCLVEREMWVIITLLRNQLSWWHLTTWNGWLTRLRPPPGMNVMIAVLSIQILVVKFSWWRLLYGKWYTSHIVQILSSMDIAPQLPTTHDIVLIPIHVSIGENCRVHIF